MKKLIILNVSIKPTLKFLKNWQKSSDYEIRDASVNRYLSNKHVISKFKRREHQF